MGLFSVSCFNACVFCLTMNYAQTKRSKKEKKKKKNREGAIKSFLGGQMMPSASLPPRPRHTFSLRTVEKLYQRQLESTGAHVRPEQIPTIVENVRRSLLRVEEVLNYRLQCPASTFHEEKERPLLSNFERVRVGQILANAVLDLAIISMVGGNEAADAVTSTRKAPSLSSSHVAAPSLHPYGTEELSDECKRQKLESNLHVGAVEETMELPEVNLLLPVGTGGGSDAGSEASLSVPGRTIVSSKNCRRISKKCVPIGGAAAPHATKSSKKQYHHQCR
ncbi:hypothetical protein TCSYLVIO_004280 [Trypanosoma cruzi]|nr:hypothetical protein TCSYLVIO_004280 [Trypanosoma cruzi]